VNGTDPADDFGPIPVDSDEIDRVQCRIRKSILNDRELIISMYEIARQIALLREWAETKWKS